MAGWGREELSPPKTSAAVESEAVYRELADESTLQGRSDGIGEQMDEDVPDSEREPANRLTMSEVSAEANVRPSLDRAKSGLVFLRFGISTSQRLPEDAELCVLTGQQID